MPRTDNRTQPRSLICVCGKRFVGFHSQSKYCSPECQREGERASWRAYSARNREERRTLHRRIYERNKDKVAARVRAYKATPRGKEATRINSKRQRIKFPEKHRARQLVQAALRKGTLKRQPCSVCGNPKSQAHHHDYSKPLDVEWLCLGCHVPRHKRHHAEPGKVFIEDGEVRQ